MSAEQITLGQIRSIIGDTAPLTIALDWMLAPDYETRVKIIDKAINSACVDMVASRHLKQKHGEDALTVEIVSALHFMSIDAAHDTDVGGHADIVVRAKDGFLWVAEAKKHSSYTWLLEGFDQLTTRYATGLPGQQNGCVLIYCFAQDAASVMQEWITRLVEHQQGIKTSSISAVDMISCHTHVGVGTDFIVTHKVIPLYWKPAKKLTGKNAPPGK